MVSMQGSWESRIIILKLAIFFIQKKPVLAGVWVQVTQPSKSFSE